MSSGVRLAIGGAIITAVTGYMVYASSASSWQYYLTVDECLPAEEDWTAVARRAVRVSGRVASGTLELDVDRRGARFALAGEQQALPVSYRGVVPDNLAEGIDVVVQGHLQGPGVLVADKVLTRCASKYSSQSGTGQE